MKPKLQTLGAAIARERRDGGQVKLSTFIPLKIRKRGAIIQRAPPAGRFGPPPAAADGRRQERRAPARPSPHRESGWIVGASATANPHLWWARCALGGLLASATNGVQLTGSGSLPDRP
ncbi:MAG: hypothetical protein DWB45_05845 [Xanthomonadales bacterium]|nr:hypothetical protein [Xanthomonadales bacterium]MDL1869527.1 hypothetical protein [Gammaproteobacteria bacterium PRO6]